MDGRDKAFVCWFLADCLGAGLIDADRIRQCIGELVEDLADRQLPTGGWSYYVTGDLKVTTNAIQSISFVTAPVLMALIRARSRGVPVEENLIKTAAACLQKMRVGSGAFAYFLHAGGRRASSGRAGAAGRGPVCELALLEAGAGSLDRVRRSLKAFMKYRAGLAKEVGKVLMHAGPDGQGCHYPMFDYAFAARAVARLPEVERASYRAPLIELLLATRSEEGAFRDAQFNGWEYGTAMALIALAALC